MKAITEHTHKITKLVGVGLATLLVAGAAYGTSATIEPSSAYADTPQTQTQAGSWVKSHGKWWYKYTDGTYPANTQVTIKGSTYSFDAKGWMKTGWKLKDGSWYYYKSSGAMATGWQKVKGTWYYLNADGKMATGWKKVDGTWYYLKASGAMATGWLQDGSDWYYLKSSGAMSTGWAKVKGSWYYLDTTSGKMKTGFYQVGNKTYYSNASGKMLTGWQKANNQWYYFDNSGAAKTSTWISGTYWVGSDGAMATSGWVDNGSYYVDAAGKYVKNPSASQLATKPSNSGSSNNSNNGSSSAATHEHEWEAQYVTSEKPVYEEKIVCSCGEVFDTVQDWSAHSKPILLSTGKGHSYSLKDVQVASTTVKELTGYKCSCGATKAA